jgi:hypothetical protein
LFFAGFFFAAFFFAGIALLPPPSFDRARGATVAGEVHHEVNIEEGEAGVKRMPDQGFRRTFSASPSAARW